MSFRHLFVVALLVCHAAQLPAATLKECEKIKLQQLKAERSAQEKSRKKSSSTNRGPSRSRQSVDKLEDWLWRNCGSYAHELRSLEQGRM